LVCIGAFWCLDYIFLLGKHGSNLEDVATSVIIVVWCILMYVPEYIFHCLKNL
jgi:hypothetical protein